MIKRYYSRKLHRSSYRSDELMRCVKCSAKIKPKERFKRGSYYGYEYSSIKGQRFPAVCMHCYERSIPRHVGILSKYTETVI